MKVDASKQVTCAGKLHPQVLNFGYARFISVKGDLIGKSIVLSPSLVSLAEIDSISITISETRLVLNQSSLLYQG
jgi:hypothetical protein